MEHTLPRLELPAGDKLLLLSCCAPCSCDVIETLAANDIKTTVLFYNPNIHYDEEYQIRLEENKKFTLRHGFDFVDLDYDPDRWFQEIKGLENEPERGERCYRCFEMRLHRTAQFAQENGFKVFADTLGISRWKNLQQVHEAGKAVAAQFPDLTYWPYNWRKQGGSQRMVELTKKEDFYRQQFCGCIYSKRDKNNWLKQKGQPPLPEA